tara:strand:+ start:438 stop:758 length:321 start_codon:yes stop_codon:yes gene_type:complete
MSGPDTFFASESLVGLFSEPSKMSPKTRVEIDGIKCSFVSYSSTNRELKVTVNQRQNPFDIFDSPSVKASIIFSEGINKILEYSNYSFKIEQLNDSYVVTIGDKDE